MAHVEVVTHSGEASVPDVASEVDVEKAPVSFSVGDKFPSFKQLEARIKTYEERNYVKFWKRDCRTIEAARKRINRSLSENIKYYEVTYCCIHGGKKFKGRGEGKRSSMTFRKDCPVELSLRASEDGMSLVVKKFVAEHNHVVSRELFKRLPHQRKLSESEEHEAQNMLSLKANKKLIQDKLASTTGKVVLLKDLTNISSQMKSADTRNDMQESIRRLTEVYGASVEVLVDQSNTLQGVFFQDQEMRDIFSAYPELVCVDATYKLLELRFPVYVMLVEDGNGQSEIAATFMLLEENEASIACMVGFFKKHNSRWESVRVLMADKDMTEREVFASAFPKAKLLICLYHTFRSFRREIVIDKMGITSGQRNMCLDMLQQMAYATSEEGYSDIYDRFCSCTPPTVVEYVRENWHPIHEQWVMGMKFSTGNFLNSTNNRLECINQKLKSVISRYSSLEEFIEKYFLILRVLRSERDHKAALSVQKVPVTFHGAPDVSLDYMKYLTPYAYQFVAKQLSFIEKVNLPEPIEDRFNVVSSEGEIEVTPTTCTCSSWLSMKLPCRHILAVRSRLNLNIFDETLCDKRWSADYYRASQRVFQDVEVSQDSFTFDVIELPAPKKRTLSQSEKFRCASKVTTKLASLASEATGCGFDSRMTLLEQVVTAWENNKKISIFSDCSSDESDGDDREPQSELMHLLSDQQREKLKQRRAKLSETAHSSGIPPHKESNCRRSQSVNGQHAEVGDRLSEVPQCGSHVPPQKSSCQSTEGSNKAQSSQTETRQDALADVTMPPIIRKRGRPKGHEVTVIGLPAKKHNKGGGGGNSASSKEKLVPFIKLHTSSKEKAMLRWFVDPKVVEAVLRKPNGVLIEEDQVEVRPENLPDAILDENVDVHLIRRYFSKDAWMIVQGVVHQKRSNPTYVCKMCYHDLDESQSIVCEHCLSWFHVKCTGLKNLPKQRYWFCRGCHESPSQLQ